MKRQGFRKNPYHGLPTIYYYISLQFQNKLLVINEKLSIHYPIYFIVKKNINLKRFRSFSTSNIIYILYKNILTLLYLCTRWLQLLSYSLL